MLIFWALLGTLVALALLKAALPTFCSHPTCLRSGVHYDATLKLWTCRRHA